MNTISKENKDTIRGNWRGSGRKPREETPQKSEWMYHHFIEKPRKDLLIDEGASTTFVNPRTDEDAKDLEILANMCAVFVDQTKMGEPTAEKRLKSESTPVLHPSQACIVLEKQPGKSLEIFHDLITHGIPGVVISRVYPEKLKRKCNLLRTPMLWLSRSGIEGSISPDDLLKLGYIIKDFTEKNTESAVLFIGLEYLMIETSFERVLGYVQELKDIAATTNSRLIISLHKDTLSSGEYTMLEREFQIL